MTQQASQGSLPSASRAAHLQAQRRSLFPQGLDLISQRFDLQRSGRRGRHAAAGRAGCASGCSCCRQAGRRAAQQLLAQQRGGAGLPGPVAICVIAANRGGLEACKHRCDVSRDPAPLSAAPSLVRSAARTSRQPFSGVALTRPDPAGRCQMCQRRSATGPGPARAARWLRPRRPDPAQSDPGPRRACTCPTPENTGTHKKGELGQAEARACRHAIIRAVSLR